MIKQQLIALLGKRDEPTDAVEEYCRHLGEALEEHDYKLILHRVAWDERGWRSALRSLRRHARAWRDAWVLVQYTALSWSSRGFPVRFLRVLKTLRAAGSRVGVVYHDASPFDGTRVIDRLRRRTQLHTMRETLGLAEAAVFTVPTEKLAWILPTPVPFNPIFIPVGANLSAPRAAFSRTHVAGDNKLSMAVYGITGGKAGRKEIDELAGALRYVVPRVKNLRLVVFGRNAQAFEADLRKALGNLDIELQVLGVLTQEDVVRTLTASDLLLFLRGPISSRRGSAIAGIACGLPVIAHEGSETASPLTEAGLALYKPQRKDDLGDVLLRVLEDEHYRASLAQKSWVAQNKYFSWRAIAARYAAFLERSDPLRKASEGLPRL